jgi:hypothetical protein
MGEGGGGEEEKRSGMVGGGSFEGRKKMRTESLRCGEGHMRGRSRREGGRKKKGRNKTKIINWHVKWRFKEEKNKQWKQSDKGAGEEHKEVDEG